MYKLQYEISKFSFIHVNRHLINTPIQLECTGVLHANLTELLVVDLLPKYHSIPALWDDYNTFRKNIAIQCEQICLAADKIVGAEGVKDKEYQMFRKRLLRCETMYGLNNQYQVHFVITHVIILISLDFINAALTLLACFSIPGFLQKEIGHSTLVLAVWRFITTHCMTQQNSVVL